MTRPGIITRVIGSPLIGLVLLSACAYLLYNWKFVGNATTLTALFAVGIAFRTLGALRRMRAYKAWSHEWETMGAPAPKDGARDFRFARRRRGPLAFTCLLAVGFPVLFATTPGDLSKNTPLILLGMLWLASCVYLLGRIVRLLRDGASTVPVTKEETGKPVSWLVSKPSSSPSRADAMKALPDYAAKLLSRQLATRRVEGRGRNLEGELA